MGGGRRPIQAMHERDGVVTVEVTVDGIANIMRPQRLHCVGGVAAVAGGGDVLAETVDGVVGLQSRRQLEVLRI